MAENLYSDDDRQYLQMMQENITRMASNSSNCKNWMVTLVAGFCAISCSIQQLNGWIIFAIAPVIVFWYLDTFYLHLERKMRNRQLDFIIKMRTSYGSDEYKKALYNLAPMKMEALTEEQKAQGFVLTNDRAFSESIKNFYLWFIGVTFVISIVLNFTMIVDVIVASFNWIAQIFTSAA